MRNTITLNGISSDTITGLLIQELPAISKPLMRTTIEEIDGRDGDIITPLGFSAYDKEITIGLYGQFDINAIIAYFNSKGTVIFSNEPDKFYNYQIINQIDFERLLRYRTATVKLHCQPFKYPTTETPVQLGSGQTVTAEGTDLTMQDTALAPFVSITPKGDTSQQTYTGKNLLNNEVQSQTISGVTVTRNTDGTLSFSGTSTAAVWLAVAETVTIDSQCYLSGCPDGGSATTYSLQTSTYGDSMKADYGSGVILPAGSFRQWLVIRSGVNASGLVFKPQIELGSTATEYEPYVGGTASPNPDYPQEVKVVTGEQTVKVSGKNLANYVPKTVAAQGLSSTYNSATGEIHITGTASVGWSDISQTIREVMPAGTYTFSVINVSGNFDKYVAFQIVDGTVYKCNIDSAITFTTTADSAQTRFWLSTTSGKVYDATIKIQIEAGSIATDYEPYQSQEYTINLGGNLFDQDSTHLAGYLNESGEPTSSDYSVYYADYIPVSSNSTYTLSYTVVAYGTSVRYVAFYDTNKAFISRTSFEATSNATITTPSNAKFIRISFRNQSGVSASAFVGTYLRNIQLEAGTKATPYTPYTPYAKIELCKIGDYQDYFYKNGNDWYLHEEIGKVILDGTEGWKGNSNVFYSLPKTDSKVAGLSLETYGNLKSICSHFTKNVYEANNIGQYYSGSTNLNFNWDGTHTNLAAFKTWLASNDVRFYAPLITATDTQITNTALIDQLNALGNANSYRDTTYITTSSNGTDLPVILAVTATGEADGTVTNAGNTYAKPKLTIYGTGNISIYLNGNQMFQIELGDENHITIDTEKMEAYKDTESNLKNRLVTGDYSQFRLQAGANQINFSGNINKCVVENYTRWL